MDSFAEQEALPYNCGVEFDITDDLAGAVPNEDQDCKEGDEECLERKRQSLAEEAVRKSLVNEIEDEADAKSLKKLSMASGPPLEPPFEGLPKDYFKKNYKPEYPHDLVMRRVCASKGAGRKTVGTLRTQPKAIFIPSDPSLATLKRRATEPKKSMVAPLDSIWTEPSPLEQNRLPPPIMSSSDELIVDWLEEHNIQMMFEYFLGLCVIHQPDDPWTFLSQLCDKMIEARSNIGAFDMLPRILTPEHTEAIYRIYDRIENGFITMAQYKSAMEAMGLTQFSMNPDGAENDAITKDTFVKESTDAINDLLRSFMINDQQDETLNYDDDQTSFSTSATEMRKSGDTKGSLQPRPPSADFSNKSRSASDYQMDFNAELKFA